MSKGRDYSITIEDFEKNTANINSLTFSETLKIVESTLFSDIKNVFVWKDGKIYDKMEFLELIEGIK